MKWTINNMPTLNEKVIIVTGGNSGLGFESVKAFATQGATVILACRDLKKGDKARIAILNQIPNASIAVMQLDIANLNSVRLFADRYNSEYNRLDILLNNAGIMMTPYSKTVDGIESQQGTNHFGHFALTALLFDKLKQTPNSRVINVSSIAHKQGKMDFDNLLYENGKNYNRYEAYSRSKLENLLFTFGLQAYMKQNKLNMVALAAHPGVSDTNLFSTIGSKTLQKILRPILNLFMQSASMGALPQIRAAVDVSVTGGEYFGPNGFKEMKGYPVLVKPANHAFNEKHISELWEISQKITGIRFP